MNLATLHNVLVLAQEGEQAEEPSGIDLVLPDPAELIWGAVCFVIVMVVLNKVAFPKLREAIQKREQQIQRDLESAENAKNEANQQLEEYKKQLAEARSEANRIVEEARQQAEQVRRDIIARAEKEAEQVVARAQEQLEAERNRTVSELQSTISELSIQLAEKIVNRSIDAEAQKDLVDAYIREVSGSN